MAVVTDVFCLPIARPFQAGIFVALFVPVCKETNEFLAMEETTKIRLFLQADQNKVWR